MKILMTGATGLIGAELGLSLTRKGHNLVIVSRNRKKALLQAPYPCEVIEGDLSERALDPEQTQTIDAVIHLLGENLSEKRWSKEQKNKIMASRQDGTRHLVESFSKPPKVFISASAIGFYGDRGSEELDENAQAGQGFLSDVCVSWEKEADQMQARFPKTRVVKARLGVVLSAQGGALEKMKPAFQVGVGGALGDGNQWMSWIHLQDAVRLFEFVLNEQQAMGPLNFVAPDPQTNRDFSKTLAKHLQRWLGPSVPSFVLKAIFGEMSQVLLGSQKVVPKKALSLGFQFQFPTLTQAFEEILNHHRHGTELFEAKQFLPFKKEKVFEFFSEAKNLERITPDLLRFQILDMSTPQIQQGTKINYKLRINGVPARWQTFIEKWDPPREFVDTALKGPYQSWHHTHHFEDLGSGTLITDRVQYRLPLGFLGWVAAHWKVRGDIQQIFDFRREAVAEIFEIK